MSRRVDHSKLRFEGNGWERDSFCLAVVEAAHVLGREASYEDVLALTTNAFAPGFDTGNHCKELWIVNAWVSHLGPVDAAWRHLGLEVEPILHPDHPGDPATPEYRRTMAGLVGAPMADGKVVITCGGWEYEREFAEPWWAGIVTEVRDDGSAYGAHLNGATRHPLKDLSSGELLAVSLAEPSLGGEDAAIEALRHAIRRIRAEGEPGAFGRHRYSAFGTDAMDDWIAQMRDVPHFCPPCQNHGRGWRAAEVVACAEIHRSAVAAAWLRKRLPDFPEPARPSVAAAAGRYDRIVELLRPALSGEGGGRYRDFVGDLEKQRAHAEGVLVAVRRELAAAADDMETALWACAPEAPDRAALARLAERAHHPYDSFSLAMQAVAAAFGRDVDYETVYALSTNCFAPDIRPDEECRQHWRMRGRGQCLDLVAGRLGLEVRPLACASKRRYGQRDFPYAEKVREAVGLVREALAGGEAVITDSGWQHDFMLWGIVTGVREDGALFGVTPNGLTENTFDHCCSFWALSPSAERTPGREADLVMLRRAVSRIRADADPFLPESLACGLPAIGGPAVPGAVIWGLPAMDRWIEQMERMPYQQDDAASSVGNARLCAWHTLHGAEVAARELRACAGRLGGAAGPHLRAAAERYERIAALLAPAVTGEGEESYARIIGDAARQKAHADVLREVKAALAAAADGIEKALASALGARFTDEEKQRLKQWGNIFGFEKMLEMAEGDPVFYDLLGQELALEPMSDSARRLRGAMGRIEPAELTYATQLDAVFAALASGEVPEDILARGGFDWGSPLWDARKARIAKLARELRRWLDEGTGELAEILGGPDEDKHEDKRRLVTLALEKLEEGSADAERLEQVRKDDGLGGFAHRIEMLDAPLWSHDRNFDLLVRGVGRLRPVGEWHTKSGPLAWGDAEHSSKPKAEAMLSKLDAWLAGGEDAGLGAREAYPEKLWLARCLATYLRYHLRGSWGWTEKGAEVKREGGRVWIEGVPILRWGTNDCTFAGAMAAALAVTDHPYTYEQIVTMSGLSFRVRWYRGREGAKWCPSCAVGEHGEAHNVFMRQSGWRFRVECPGGGADMTRFIPDVVASIDAGKPVVCYDDKLDMAVLHGYADGGRTLMFRDYHAGERPHELPAEKLGWLLYFIDAHTDPTPKREAMLETLRFVVHNWRREPWPGDRGEYLYGDAALEAWSEDIGNAGGLTPEERNFLFFVNWWNFSTYADVGRFARPFLEEAAGALGGDAAGHLRSASDHYGRIGPVMDVVFGEKAAFLGPWSGKGPGEWTAEVRERERRILADIRTHSAAAVEEIGKALVAARVEREGDRVTLAGLDHRADWVSYMGALVSCARFLDPDVSESWLWGSTGYAFSLTVHEQLCPSGPYMPKFDHLVPNTGFTLETLSVEATDEDAAREIERMFGRARAAIDAGLPVMGWSLEHIDWYPICGYDAQGNYLFLRHDGRMGTYPHAKLGELAPGGLALLHIVEPAKAPDDAVVVRDALRFALRMGRGEFSHEQYTSGPGGYDVWIKALERPQNPISDGTCFGHAFNAACWHQCRRHALAFLEEARKRLDDETLSPLFDDAIARYRTVADRLGELTELHPCQPGNDEPTRARFEDAELRRKAVPALTAARAAEAEALKVLAEIEKALAAIGEAEN